MDASYALAITNVDQSCSTNLFNAYGAEQCKYYKELEIVSHVHDEIVVHSIPGYGRRYVPKKIHQVKM